MPGDHMPEPIALLVGFANTYDVEDGEMLGTPAQLRDWLAGFGLLSRRAAVNETDLALAHDLRAGFRAAMAAHHDGGIGADRGLSAAAARLPLVVGFEGPLPRLVPTGSPVQRALGSLLVAAQEIAADGRWARLKLCAATTCAWAFYDASKNHSRTWCSMRVCGNRQKTRTYRRRQAVSEH